MQQDPNYGSQREPDSPVGDPIGPTDSPTGGPSRMSLRDERTWSILAHLSILLWLIIEPMNSFLLITVFLQPVTPFIIWLVYKDRSPKVAFHALQALWYQVAWTVIFVVLGFIGLVVGAVLTVLTFGLALFILIPLAIVVGLIPIAHGCYAAYKISQGVDYRYPIIADMIDGRRRIA